MLDLRVEQPEGREQARRGRDDDGPHPHLLRHPGREQRSVAAEGEQRVVARVAPALGRDGADGPDHVRDRHLPRAPRPVLRRKPERARHLVRHHAAACLGVDRELAPAQERRVQVTQHHAGVGDRRRLAAEAVAHRTRPGPGAPRPDLHRAAGVDVDDRAAARPDLREIDGRDVQQVPAAGEQARAGHDAAAHRVLAGAGVLAALDERRLGGGPAHVEADDVLEPRLARDRARSHHTRGRTRTRRC